ncbi:MICAL-like protein 2a isoform X2 [Chiloscyllium punctatum]|uniref:MICAL-like protein 2a isoform X2 n=1 Tax=Chiloscyllium punctatum TaxID=137246 RepID=UPI003B639040
MAAIKALQQWCKKHCEGYRNVEITNMTTSWRDGLAFCAILHHFRPDLIDFDSLKKENVYENNKLAFQVAEEQLGIPALLDAEDMVALRVPDRLSILTYVSQYYNYFTGRSPIGGMAHIKRPASDSAEEPVRKKSTPETQRKVPKNAVTPTAVPASQVAPTNKVPAADAGARSNKSGTLSSSCAICKKNVLLVQRYLVDGKLYHRNCFRCKQCSNTLMAGAYKTGPIPGTFICTNHQANVGGNNNNSSSSSSSSFVSSKLQKPSPKADESVPTVHKPVVGHVTSPTAVTNTPRQAEVSSTAFKPGGTHAERMQAARQKFMSSGTPEKPPLSDLGSPASALRTPDSVRGQYGGAETITQRPRSPGNQQGTNVLKSPTATTRSSSDMDKDKARLVLQKNLPFDKNNNLNQGVTSSSRFHMDKPSGTQPMNHQTTKTITLNVSDQKNVQAGTRQSTSPEQRGEPSNPQDKASKWRPTSALELPSRPVLTKGVASPEAVLSPSTGSSSRGTLNRAASMNEATGRGSTLTQQTTSKGNFSYSPQIITRQEAEDSPSDWRLKLKPVQKHHSFGSTDIKQMHSSSINVDIKKPSAFGNTGNTPSTPKTAAGSNWTPSSPSTGGGKQIAVTFSLHNPSNTTVSTSPVSPAKGVSGTEAKTFHSTQQKRVLKPAAELLAGVKDGIQSPIDKSPVAVSPFEQDIRRPQGFGSSHQPALDQVTEESPGRQSWVQGKSATETGKSARAKFFESNCIPEDPKKSQGHGDSPTTPEKSTSSQRISEEDIRNELQDIGKKLDALEQKGVELEPQLRSCEGDENEDELMVEWFKLIHEKQLLMRRESELVYISKQQNLEDHQGQILEELRVLMEKADSKTERDRLREKELLEELLRTVEGRNEIIDGLDEDRVREMEEDQMMEAMIKRMDMNKDTEQDLKKRNKFNPLKFLKGLAAKPKGK